MAILAEALSPGPQAARQAASASTAGAVHWSPVGSENALAGTSRAVVVLFSIFEVSRAATVAGGSGSGGRLSSGRIGRLSPLAGWSGRPDLTSSDPSSGPSSSMPGGAGLRPSKAASKIMSDCLLPLPRRRTMRLITPRRSMSASTRRTVRSPSAV